MLLFAFIVFIASLSILLGSAWPAVIVSGALIAIWLTVTVSDKIAQDRARRRRIARARERRATRDRRGF